MSDHINCGGNLVYHHSEGNKTIFLCHKCKRLVNVVQGFSYNEYVDKGFIDKPVK